MRRKTVRRGAVFATSVAFGLAALTGTTVMTPVAFAAGGTTDCNSPSNADFTGNGANVHGAYDSTCDGTQGGNGGGHASDNEPCAGCVGQADNKNPHGQAPDGSDPNAGYECDRNQGVGQGNPAHTGCQGDDTTGGGGTTCPSGAPMPESGDCGGGDGGGGTGGSGGGGGVSSSSTPDEVLGEHETRSVSVTPGTPNAVEAATVTAAAPSTAPAPSTAALAAASTAPAGQLAFTGPGSLTSVLAAVGALLLLVGMALIKLTRVQPQFA